MTSVVVLAVVEGTLLPSLLQPEADVCSHATHLRLRLHMHMHLPAPCLPPPAHAPAPACPRQPPGGHQAPPPRPPAGSPLEESKRRLVPYLLYSVMGVYSLTLGANIYGTTIIPLFESCHTCHGWSLHLALQWLVYGSWGALAVAGLTVLIVFNLFPQVGTHACMQNPKS